MAPTPFQNQVYLHMRRKRIDVVRIIRIFQPIEPGDDLIEVLYKTKKEEAGTVFVNVHGDIVLGPYEGFGI
jgi:hypothetical protein